MDFAELYHFLFETYVGIGVLALSGLVLSLIAAVVMEFKTRKTFVDRGPRADEDEWSFFDDEQDEAKDR